MKQERVNQILEDLKKQPWVVKKYNRPGCYSISIGEKLVYIGKSRNMLVRLAQHIDDTAYSNSHKYEILREAQSRGYNIKFDVLYCGGGVSQDEIDSDIGVREGELIRQYCPPLNTQIPFYCDYHRYKYNKSAKTITLGEILGRVG